MAYNRAALNEARELKEKFKANGRAQGNWFSGSWKSIESDQQCYYELYQQLKQHLKMYGGKPEGVAILSVIGDEHANEGYAWTCGIEFERPLYTSNKVQTQLMTDSLIEEYDKLFKLGSTYSEHHSKPFPDSKTGKIKLSFSSEEEAIAFLEKNFKKQKENMEATIHSTNGDPKWKVSKHGVVDMKNNPVNRSSAANIRQARKPNDQNDDPESDSSFRM